VPRLLDDLGDLSCIGAPAVAVIGVPAAMAAAAVGAWGAAVPLGLAAVGAAGFTRWPRRRMPAPSPGANGWRIVASNLWYRNPSIERAAHDLVASQPDVLVVSELQAEAHEVLVDAFEHHEVLSIGGPRGHGVYSRFPLERLAGPDVVGPVLHLRVQAPEPFALLAVHLPRATIIDRPGDGTESVSVCRAEVFELAAWLDAGPPSVLAGDLNLTDRQPGYRRLVRGRLDAMRTSRARDTFLAMLWRPMAMRIDHLIVPRGWAVADARVVRVSGSDHRAITAVVEPR
jgi:endonuclease/exonuclease/phosphatase (EEP) superfamily protein YafD